MKQVSRYHPLLVTLHWLLAVLIIAALAIGFFVLAAMPNVDPQKIGVLRVHMAGGMLILALMVIRFAVRMWTSRPAAATTGYPLLDRIAPITHYGFYVLVLLMVGSGYTTAILAGLPAIVFGGSGAPLLPDFQDLSELCGTRLYCDGPCRLNRFARVCHALPSIRYERQTVPANVLRPTCPQFLGSDGMIPPSSDELSDYERTALKLMLLNKPRGVRRVNDRRVPSWRWPPVLASPSAWASVFAFAGPALRPSADRSRHRRRNRRAKPSASAAESSWPLRYA